MFFFFFFVVVFVLVFFLFFFNDTATTEIYTLSLHDALPICVVQKIVDEANLAFQLNRNVMHDLEPLVKDAVGDQVFEQITRQERSGSTEHHHRSSGLVSAT